MKQRKNKDLNDYVYIRLSNSIKKSVREIAKNEGSNMTIWIRQLIMRELESKKNA